VSVSFLSQNFLLSDLGKVVLSILWPFPSSDSESESDSEAELSLSDSEDPLAD
jgi:hypothetical protein